MAWSYCENCGTCDPPKPQVKLKIQATLSGVEQADDEPKDQRVPSEQEQKTVYVCSDCGCEVEYGDDNG